MNKKVLYAVQATGNGHLSRALEFYPTMIKYRDVDVLLSGIQGDLELPFEVKYRFHGAGFIFGKKGGIDYWATTKTMKPLRFFKDVYKLDLSPYSLIVNDFEPISAYTRKWRFPKIDCVALSHQAAFFSNKIPRPKRKGYLAEFIFKYFAPSTRKVGLHFQAYDKDIFTPVIRQEIRNLQREYIDNEVVIYLPSYAEETLIQYLRPIKDYNFTIFSKHTDRDQEVGNIRVFPVGKERWMRQLARAANAIIGAGFQGASEMLFLNKKVLAIPMLAQYEQECNAQALEELGAHIVPSISDGFTEQVRSWLSTAAPMQVQFPDHTDQLVRRSLGID